ncbi:MAG TPA: gliding motility-associated C-terminal domain-containing protein [Bacteroidia bacterium]|nr:gliding motility-associated C-terminal domain-containing protein [Bacteroidia bacterium]
MNTFTFINQLGNKLNKLCLLTILTVATTVLSSQKVQATHAAGADLTYRCLGGLQYEIEATFYRDCGGVAEPSSITINYKSVIKNVNLTLTANKIAGTGQEITVPCQTSASTCNNGSSVGIRKFVYRATITLPSASTDWVFSYSVCCRNCAITTIQNPCANSSLIYVEAKLNNQAASCNSSPVFSNVPIAFVCIGQNFNYNHGVLDADGDSLAYQIITPKISETSNVTYISPNSTTMPVQSSTPFTVNTLTGDMNFTPTLQQIGILAILVKEYRNGVQIGSVIRDMQVYTVPCSNSLPTASGINGTNSFSIDVCPNQQVCFNINTNDADATQVVSIANNIAQSIPTATVTVGSGNRPTLTFCWTPTSADIGPNPNTFTVTVQDNACPTNGVQTFSYNIYVPGPNFNVTSTNITCNGANNGTATATPVSGNGLTYSWNTTPVQTTPTATNLAPGTYAVTVTNAGGCSMTKSVTITQPTELTVGTTVTNVVCVGQCNGGVDLTATGGTGTLSYAWSNGQTTQDVTGLCAGTYTVTVTDANSCTKVMNPVVNTTSNISGSITATNVLCNGANTGSADLSVADGSGSYTYLWSNGVTTQDLTNVPAGNYSVTVTDGALCTKSFSVNITQPAAAINLNNTVTNVNCFGNSTGAINLTTTGGTAPYTYAWSNGATTQNISNVPAGAYTVTVTDGNGCTDSQVSVNITQPVVELSVTTAQTQVNCFGNNTGAINITPAGGTAPYSYAWSNGANTQDLSNITAGTYSVTITDSKGCSTTATGIAISQPAAALTSSITSGNVNCFANATGSINLTANGGTTPYTFAWSNGATTQNLSGITAATYSVTVTDANGCTSAQNSITITQPSAALSNSHTITNVNCFGNNTGAITQTVTGGTTPYTFLWSNGANTQSLTNIAAGNYSVTITDANGCTNAVATMAVTQPAAALSSNNYVTNVNCFGNNTGAIDITVQGGTIPYSYQWSNGATSQDINNIASGTYTVTITDANGCTTASMSMNVNQPAAALASTIAGTQQVNCFGNATGGVNINVTGGTSPYTYLWSNGATTQNISNVPSGTYSVNVTDANGCNSTIASINISQPSASLSASVTGSQNVSCNGGGNGSVDLTVNGGTTPYTYQWSNGATTQDISGLNTGSYTATITDANGCTTSVNATVTQPAGALATSVSSSSNVLCFGGNNGAINLNVAGGTAPYSYVWSNSTTTQDLNGLPAGTYSVTVTDANGCTNTATQTITQPTGALSASGASSQNVSCHGLSNGAITLTVNGGTSPYSYQWSNGASTQNINNIPAGSYSVTVTDANSCVTTANGIAVSQPGAALASSVNATQNVGCFGGATGSISLNATGGTSPYSYSWSNGATTQNISNLQAGSYSVTVTDANGCTTFVNAIAISQPGASLATSVAATQNVSCFGGNNASVDLNVSGGTQPYSYNWSNGSTTQDLSGIPAGTYGVTVTDANGCTIQQSSITITQPAAAVSTSTTSTNVGCFGSATASVNLTVNGGTSPYSYNWSNGASTQSLTNIPAGTYSVVVTDANGCTANGAVVTITQPAAALFTSASSTQVLCFGNSTGAINLTVTGGTSPYTYSWSNGATSQNLTNIAAGNYTVTVTDANGCTSQQTSLAIAQPSAALAASVASTVDVSCNGGQNGSINLTVNGGTAPYSYNWSNGAVTQDISGVVAGIYSVTITDANGCTRQINPIGINQPTNPITTSVTTGQNVSCNGGGNGSIDLTVTGGTSPYSYNWSNGATTQDISNLYAGTYGVAITDANGCTAAATGTVSQPAGALSTSIASSQNILCHAGNNGSITLSASGGTAPYTFAWSNGATTQNLTGLSAGTFAVTVTDGNGCISTSSAVITQPDAALSALVASANAVLCNGGNNGSIDVTITGGTAPYSYQWSNGASTQDLTGLSAGSFTVTVTDANGCKTTLPSVIISQPSAALASTVNVSSVNCFGNNTGAIDLTVTGGTSPYSYLWSNGATTQDLTNISAGIYTVNVTDANGCTVANNALSVTQPTAALSTGFNVTDVSCFGNASGAITLTINGGTLPYSYQWSNGSTQQNLINVPVGTYTVTVTDANGCTSGVASMQITQPSAALSINNAIDDVNCFGGNTGSIDLTINGGTMPYSYVWSNGATTEDLTNVAAGTYTVTVTDAQGCTVGNSTLSIQQPAAALASNVTGTVPVACYGNSTGSIDLTITGGTSPYSYSWSNGATTQDLTNIPSGTYTVSVTDAQGCSSTIASITITQPTAGLSASVTSTGNVACNGGGNGSVDLTVAGGTSPYTFTWSNGATTEDINNLYAGTYNVSITDANGCTANSSATVSQPAGALASSIATSQNILCYSQNTGSVTLNVTGGTAPYSYNWSNGATTQNINNVASGSYSVTVTDANNCISTSSVTLSQPTAALSASTTATQNVNCFGIGDGSININVTGGTSPYSYNWSNGATTQNLTGLQAGVYSVTVTDANGCIENINAIAISQPAQPLNAAIGASQNVNCFGQSTGSISLNVNGGTSPYNYVWSNGANASSITNLVAGTYSVTITDANNCTTAINSIAVNEPAAALSAIVTSSQNVNCTGGANGTVDLTVTGGTTPYSYQWNTGAITEDLSGLVAGTYTVTVTDVNGCTSNITANVTQPANVVGSNVNASTNVNCFGGNNGSVDLTVNGGTTPYNFVWSNGETTEDINNLVSGVYTVTVTDAQGCTTGNTVTITQPTATLSSAVASSQNINCYGGNNGAIDLTVTGGTTPYSFNWDNGATSEDLSGLSSGTYNVTVTDANGCTSVNSVFLSQPAASLASAITNSQNIFCNGGNNGFIDLTVTGGTMPYTISWSNGASTQNLNGLTAGTYNVTVTDAQGCSSTTGITISEPSGALNTSIAASQPVLCFGNNTGSIDISVTGGTSPYVYSWSNGSVNEDLDSLHAGSYTVTVTDAQGCTYTLNTNITEPQGALASTVSINQQVSCFGGNNASVDLTVAGGTPPYSYNWSNGATSEDINNLVAGTYTVSITDANGCTLTSAATITQPQAALSGNITQTAPILCHGGNDASIDLVVTGGTSPYSYNWSNGETTEDLSNIPAGTYNVTITDQNGCTFSASVTITQPSGSLTPTISSTGNVGCYGNSTGSVTLTITGGTQPYQFIWNNGATTQSLSNVAAGSYTVTVTDANGCTNTATANVQQPSGALSASPSFNTVNCDTLNSVDIISNPFGGSPPYNFSWSTGNTSQNLLNVGAGTYSVTITDANGCTFATSVNVVGPTQLFAVTSSTTNAGCNGMQTGSVTLTATGGIAPYTYVWSNGATTSSIQNVAAGTYTATVTDNYGCTRVVTSIVNQPAQAMNATLTPNNVACYNDSSGVITLVVNGGTAPYTFLWNNGATTQNATGIAIGTYTVTVTDANGCTWDSSASITQPASALTVKGYETNSNCLNQVPGAVDINITGGTPPFTYLWSNGATTQNVAGLGAGTYTVTVTDANGCQFFLSKTVIDESNLTMSAAGPTEFCMGGIANLQTQNVANGVYQWYHNNNVLTGANQNVYATPVAGTYYVSVTNQCGTFNSNPVEVKVYQVGTISVSANQMICPALGEFATLSAYGGSSYKWTPGFGLSDSTIANPVATPAATTTYQVTVTSTEGCSASAEVTINVVCDTLFVPTGFSPDGNAMNDTYVIDGLSKYPGNKIYVYNRWGNLVYKKKDYDNTWDGTSNVSGIYLGKQLPNGTYFFILDLNNGSKPMQGYITLKK